MVDEDIRNRLQLVVSELQNAAQQLATINGQFKELEGTLLLLKSQDEDRSVYRQSGPLLLEVSDRVELISDIKKSIAALTDHSKILSDQEGKLRSQYEDIVKQFEGS